MSSQLTYWNPSQQLPKSDDYHLITGLNPNYPIKVPIERGEDELGIEFEQVRVHFTGVALHVNFTKRPITLPDRQISFTDKFFMPSQFEERHYAVFSPEGLFLPSKLNSLLKFSEELQKRNRVFALIPLTYELSRGKRENLWAYLDNLFTTYS